MNKLKNSMLDTLLRELHTELMEIVVKCTEDICPQQVICEYIGEIINYLN